MAKKPLTCRIGTPAMLNRYIGYWEPYANSHLELDADIAIQGEVRNGAAVRPRR